MMVLCCLYFLMIRPQQKRQKEMQKMLDALQVNDKVITSGYGRIVSIKPDKYRSDEIDDTNKVRVVALAVAAVITPEDGPQLSV